MHYFKYISSNLMRIFEKLRKKKHFDTILSKVISFLMRLSFYTTRWTVIGGDIPDFYHKNSSPFIVCLWHDRLMMAPCVWRWSKQLHVLASNHRDGRLIAKVVNNFSMPAIYGSTGKNGMVAVRKLIQLVKSGEYIAIIPDGPRGPRHKLAPGIIAVSRLTKADILPFSFCVKRYFRLNSWDKFIFVWPFNRGVMVWGNPISANELKLMSEDESIKCVESKINKLSNEAYKILYNA